MAPDDALQLWVVYQRLGDLLLAYHLTEAGPRDVVEIHVTALRAKTRGALPMKAKVYASEGQLRLIELMGYLVSYYRNRLRGRQETDQPGTWGAEETAKGEAG